MPHFTARIIKDRATAGKNWIAMYQGLRLTVKQELASWLVASPHRTGISAITMQLMGHGACFDKPGVRNVCHIAGHPEGNVTIQTTDGTALRSDDCTALEQRGFPNAPTRNGPRHAVEIRKAHQSTNEGDTMKHAGNSTCHPLCGMPGPPSFKP